ncbi:MAG: hypothetical protein FWG96_03085 [Methanomassiliicoccaceae archaeon]|nr:hypothetical protein [Methanomassiliicoccaceae archaeon]
MMEFMKGMRKDRAGISTILVIAAVVIVVIAAAVAYIVLSADNEKEEVAPGTTMKYEVSMGGETLGMFEIHFIGQNADEYLIMEKEVEDASTTTAYRMSPKGGTPVKVTGTEELDTIDGKKTLQIQEFTQQVSGMTAQVKAYVDPSNGLPYKEEISLLGMSMTQILVGYELKWQTSYKESKSVGMTYDYVCKVEGLTLDAKIVCVADCVDDQYGVMYDFTAYGGGTTYFISDFPQGLPVDAEHKGGTTAITTIDGDISVELWEYVDPIDGTKLYFYIESDTHIIYRFVVDFSVAELVFDLTKKSA